jgi:dihydroorotase
VEWNAQHPVSAERQAVESLLGAPSGLRLHIAHVTNAETARRIRSAGQSFEATPHHLLLDDRSGADAQFKVNPPLRSPAERQALYDEFRSGGVPMLASDHAPHSGESKEREFAQAPSGMPGVETLLPLFLARVRDGDLALNTLLAAAAERPALWLGLPQGRIAPGYRANLCVVDFGLRRRLRADDLHFAGGWTAFERMEATFPTDHFLDGERIVEDGEYVGTPRGRVMRPEYADPSSRSSSAARL